MFSLEERQALLALHGVGPVVIFRLEQIGYASLSQLCEANVTEIVTKVSKKVGSTCWQNSPQAKKAIQTIIDYAQSLKLNTH